MIAAIPAQGRKSPTEEAQHDDMPKNPAGQLPIADNPTRSVDTGGSTRGARLIERTTTAAVVGAAVAFVIANTRPWTWVLDTTPTGGDLGAHVWAPAYLRDALLGELRLTGWTNDWYAGFPAFTFYMVIPSLLVVIFNIGLPLPVDGWALLAAGMAAGAAGWHLARRLPKGLHRMAGIAGFTAASFASRALDRLDGDTLSLLGYGALAYNDDATDRFLAAVVLPALMGYLTWRSLSAQTISPQPGATAQPLSEVTATQTAGNEHSRLRLPLTAAAVAGTLLAVPMPYGVALKLVAIAGVVLLPLAAYTMVRIAGLGFPGPALAAVAALPFLFDRSHNIYGGNLMSTMAGEFAYSLSLVLAVLYIGVAYRGMTTGRHCVLAGVLLALTALTHLFPALLTVLATGIMLIVLPWRHEALWTWLSRSMSGHRCDCTRPCGSAAGSWKRLTQLLTAERTRSAAERWTARGPAQGALRMRLRWTAVTGALAAALSAWWVLPFWWNRGLLNDMGWGKERRYLSALWSRSEFDYDFLVNDPPLQFFVVLAAAGALLGLIRVCLARRGHLAVTLAALAVICAAVFVFLPEGRLWNVRILPFYYLSIYLSALLGLGEALSLIAALTGRASAALSRASKRSPQPAMQAPRLNKGGASESQQAPAKPLAASHRQPSSRQLDIGVWVRTGALAALAVSVAACLFVLTGMALRGLPGGRVNEAGVYQWGPFETAEYNLGPSWVQYNYEGYERRRPTDAGGGASEYFDLVNTMTAVAEEHGCGTALWEYEADRLGSYGTPMALMLLPHWTDRCIGSMEGLYFESSGTTPFHFLMQSELSESPSRAQRDIPYSNLDAAAGIKHLQLMGVRYYLAFSPAAIGQARSAGGLTEVAASGPWVVFLVEDSSPVAALNTLPVVIEDLSAAEGGWFEVAMGAFTAGVDMPLLAAAGPGDWPRMRLTPLADELDSARSDIALPGSPQEKAMRRLAEVLPEIAPRQAVSTPVEVSDIVRGNHLISFTVSRIGVPILVRTSYFPNWSASGAEGPYRVTPNLMVVVPTDVRVELSYGRSGVESASLLITLAGLAAAGWLALRQPREPAASMQRQTGRTAIGVGEGRSAQPTEHARGQTLIQRPRLSTRPRGGDRGRPDRRADRLDS